MQMEINGSSNHHSCEDQPSTGSSNANKGQSTDREVFVNRAEITWLEVRRQWVGDQSQKPKRMSREPISWTTTYEDLLCSTEHFQQPIPLAEMVDFLVDTWHDEGLFD